MIKAYSCILAIVIVLSACRPKSTPQAVVVTDPPTPTKTTSPTLTPAPTDIPTPTVMPTLSPTTDQDNDFLPDTIEENIQTSVVSIDTDDDGLSDYEEYVKYLTDPLSPDSDNDGIVDNDWNERREFSHNLYVRVRISYNVIEVSNEYFFIDMRIVSGYEEGLGYTELELVIGL